MLQYFPTPYPDELWYSVLCRYHIRSGNLNQITTKNGRTGIWTLFPDNSVHDILSQLPKDIFSVRDMILNHTLFPYFSRIYPQERKQGLLNDLSQGTLSGETSGRKVTKGNMPTLRVCPVCRKQDKQRYGESYWHREHQIPYMTVCPKHHCRLMEYQCKNKQEFQMGVVLPDFVFGENKPNFEVKPHEIKLSEILCEFLTLSLEKGATDGYNNLFLELNKKGYGTTVKQHVVTLNTEKLQKDLISMFGNQITRACFGKHIASYTVMKLRNWTITSPEPYALLSTLANQEPKITFGARLGEIPIEKRLIELRKSGTVYTKQEVAYRIGIRPMQLDNIAGKYNIEPFWYTGQRAAANG